MDENFNSVKDFLKMYDIILRACVFIHVTYAVFYAVINIPTMVAFNLISTVIYIFLVFLLYVRRCSTVIILVSYIEVTLHVIVSTVLLGWEYGFALQIITLIPLAFYCPLKSKLTPFIFSFSMGLTFLGLRVYTYYYTAVLTDIAPLYAERLMFLYNTLISLFVITLHSVSYTRLNKVSQNKLTQKNISLQHLAETDPLTGMGNRRSIISRLELSFKIKEATGENFVIMISDIDDFKTINDKYGHDCGDYVLKTIAKIMPEHIGKCDYICRWGGEEILLLLTDSEIERAKYVGEEIRHAIESYDFKYASEAFKITITLGASCSDGNTTINEMLLQADKNLYCGKSNGKNCVVCNVK